MCSDLHQGVGPKMWKKVIGPTILVSLLWIAGSSITNYYAHRVYEYHSRVLEENVSTIRAAWAMQDCTLAASGDRHGGRGKGTP